jgi:SAM-dependent methyltransferase
LALYLSLVKDALMPTLEIRRGLKELLSRSPAVVRDPLSRLALRANERYVAARQAPSEEQRFDSGLPVPPPKLRVLVVGHADAENFLETGRRDSEMVRQAAKLAGQPVEQMKDILDWGCGCGRVARWSKDLTGPQIHACDYNEELVGWVATNLPFIDARNNDLTPPLPYEAHSMDYVYALSIFTHFTDELAVTWMQEMHRILRPGGLLFFTTHGARYRDRLTAEENARFATGGSVVQFASVEGTNLCAAYHPRSFVESTLTSGFEVLSVEEVHLLTEEQHDGKQQDRYLIRKR